MTKEERMEKMRQISGAQTSSDPLVSFLYGLIRDHLPAGTVERMVLDVEEELTTRLFSNGWLAQYAMNLADRLKNANVNQLAQEIEVVFGDGQEPNPSDKRPSFKKDVLEKIKQNIRDYELEEEETDDLGLSLVNELEASGQLPKEEADRLKKEIEECIKLTGQEQQPEEKKDGEQ